MQLVIIHSTHTTTTTLNLYQKPTMFISHILRSLESYCLHQIVHGAVFEFCSDLYEGTRKAEKEDFSGIKQLIQPLEACGILVKRSDEEVCLTMYLLCVYCR